MQEFFDTETAYAKINLTLNICGKREDGFHDLQSFVAFSEFGDIIKVKDAQCLSLELSGEFGSFLQNSDANIILQAAHLLRQKAQIKTGACISSEKNIPIMAGLGGGSADAAATLRLLNRFWKLNWTLEDLKPLAVELGSDVLACLYAEMGYMTWRGDKFMPVEKLNDKIWVLLTNPHKCISTQQVFTKMKEPFSSQQAIPHCEDSKSLFTYMKQQGNDLTMIAIDQCKEIMTLLSFFKDVPSSLSGSGASVFALYENEQEVNEAHKEFKAAYPDYWSVVSVLKN